MSGQRRRNPGLERTITHYAALGTPDPAALIAHAEERARSLSGEYVTDPMLVQAGRDRPLDVLEELADARNHLVWWLEESLDHPLAARRFNALRHIIIAYSQLQED